MTRDRKLVVAALIQDRLGSTLLTRRREDQPMGGLWELPGGKIEEGEPPTQALEREIREELGVGCVVERIYDVVFFAYPTFDLLMLVYRCRLEGRPRAVEVAEFAWVETSRLTSYDVLPADGPLIARLVEEQRLSPAR